MSVQVCWKRSLEPTRTSRAASINTSMPRPVIIPASKEYRRSMSLPFFERRQHPPECTIEFGLSYAVKSSRWNETVSEYRRLFIAVQREKVIVSGTFQRNTMVNRDHAGAAC